MQALLRLSCACVLLGSASGLVWPAQRPAGEAAAAHSSSQVSELRAALVRGDGVIVPFAVHRDSWQRLRPVVDTSAVPLDWWMDGNVAHTRAVPHVSAAHRPEPTFVRTALLAAYDSVGVVPDVLPVVTGMAFSARVSAQILRETSDTVLANRVRTFLVSALVEREDAAAARSSDVRLARLARTKRREHPGFALRDARGSAHPAVRYVWIDGRRRLGGEGGGPACAGESRHQGWLAVDSTETRVLELELTLGYCGAAQRPDSVIPMIVAATGESDAAFGVRTIGDWREGIVWSLAPRSAAAWPDSALDRQPSGLRCAMHPPFPQVAGVVFHQQKAIVMPHAQIVIATAEPGGWCGALSDSGGRFGFAGMPPGRYLLQISSIGYDPGRRVVVVPSQAAVHLRMGLRELKILPDEIRVGSDR